MINEIEKLGYVSPKVIEKIRGCEKTLMGIEKLILALKLRVKKYQSWHYVKHNKFHLTGEENV